MAAKPIERFVKKQIAEQGGWDRIIARIASGDTIAGVARTLYRPDGLAIDRSTLSNMLRRDPERAARVKQARTEGASAMVDQALHLVDDAALDKDAIQKARVQAELRVKVAGLIDRESYGPSQPQVNVQVNVEGMHLDALRHRRLPTVGGSVQQIGASSVSPACETG